MNTLKTKCSMLLLLGCCLMFQQRAGAQGVHFSQFQYANTLINPAEAGAFYGTARVGGMYRDQYRQVSSNPFKTMVLYGDTPLRYVTKKKRDWIGLGAMVYTDKVGLAALSTNAFGLSAAYHHVLGTSGKHVATLGASYGLLGRRNKLGSGSLLFEDEIDPNGVSMGTSSQDRTIYANNASYQDLGLGLRYAGALQEGLSVTVGASLAHVNKPSLTNGNTDYTLPMRMLAYVAVDKALGTKLSFMPQVFYAKMGEANQLQLQALMAYRLNSDLRVKGGLGSRLGESVQIFLGADFKNFDVGLGYDLNTSALSNTNTGGSLELAMNYRYVRKKKVQSKPTFICPQL